MKSLNETEMELVAGGWKVKPAPVKPPVDKAWSCKPKPLPVIPPCWVKPK
ncbi:hypothetical protein MXF36_21140 [Pseudomonas aeruginosa]|nr:hypothetical protein [Pseudomonas aeruginosa]MEB6162293.1 hypothetical protein [Pseudomonas aeruginosa]